MLTNVRFIILTSLLFGCVSIGASQQVPSLAHLAARAVAGRCVPALLNGHNWRFVDASLSELFPDDVYEKIQDQFCRQSGRYVHCEFHERKEVASILEHRLCVVCSENVVDLYNLVTGALMHTLEHAAPVERADISEDDESVISIAGNTIYIWNVREGTLRHKLSGFVGEFPEMKVSVDGSIIVVVTESALYAWNEKMNAGTSMRPLAGYTGDINALAISYDNNFIVAVAGNALYVWNASTGELIHRLSGSADEIKTIRISYDNSFVVAVAENTLYVWDINSGALKHTLVGHTDSIRVVKISRDNKFIFSGANDHTIRIWNVCTGVVKQVLNGHAGMISALVISKDSTCAVSGAEDNTVCIWDVQTGSMKHRFDVHDAIATVAISPDNKCIVALSTGRAVIGWKLQPYEDALKGVSQSIAWRQGTMGYCQFLVYTCWPALSGCLSFSCHCSKE